MAIQIGDRLPDVQLPRATPDGPRPVSTGELFRGKRAVLFAVPGAFTPTCSDHHLPGFLERAAEIRAKGVDLIACLAVNDPFVLAAWGRDRGVGDDIVLLADGSGDFTRAVGLELDASAFAMGRRSLRYAALVEDGVVRALLLDRPGELRASTAEAVLALL
jgi:glutaredoxin/glutathione-dependent peroxiredoxin